MHLRRALLLFAVVLFVAALVSLVAPRPRQTETQQPIAALPPSPAPERSVRLRYPVKRPVPAQRLMPGEHLELEVDATVTGQATAFGILQPAEPLTPARFDVLAPASGRYPVTFQPTSGTETPVGIFTVSVAPASGSGRRP
jgi:hypothetical protein